MSIIQTGLSGLQKIRVLNTIGDVFDNEAKNVIASFADADYKIPSQEEFEDIAGEYDALIVGLGLQVNRALLKKSDRLRAVATATTGLDHIDLDAARESGVEVLSLRGETEFLNSITGTAELAFGLLIDLMRRSPWAFEAVKRYEWRRGDFCGWNLSGKTLGVVGLGRLGKIMARQGAGFGMKVVYCDPIAEKFSVFGDDIQRAGFEELLEMSDAVSIHVHLADDTENMFSTPQFKAMKESAYLINTSRGKIVNEARLLDALKAGELAGYGTDVLSGELDFPEKGFLRHPLVEYSKVHQNCLIVPHIGGMTYDSRIATDAFIANKLVKFFKNGIV